VPVPAAFRHPTAVDVSHTVVEQASSPMNAVGLLLTTPKLRPDNVKDEPSHVGRLFGESNETTGASKLNVPTRVPTNVSIVRTWAS